MSESENLWAVATVSRCHSDEELRLGRTEVYADADAARRAALVRLIENVEYDCGDEELPDLAELEEEFEGEDEFEAEHRNGTGEWKVSVTPLEVLRD